MKHLAISALSTVLASMMIPSPPGDLEVIDLNGTDVVERWSNPNATLQWHLVTQNNMSSVYGLDAPSLTTFSAGLAPIDTPGVSSLVAAAKTWNDVLVPDTIFDSGAAGNNSGSNATTIRFSENPVYIDIDEDVNGFDEYLEPVYQISSFHTSCNSTTYYGINGSASKPHPLKAESQGSSGAPVRNTVQFVYSHDYWKRVLNIPTLALAAAMVTIDQNTGEIVEFDIGFNRTTGYWLQVQGDSGCYAFIRNQYYSFLHDSTTLQRVIGFSGGTLIGGGYPAPSVGFADVQGVATHEFGHALGLGHTFETASVNLHKASFDEPTEFPTMFPISQVSTIEQSYAYPPSSPQAPGEVIDTRVSGAGNWTSADINDPSTWPTSTLADQTIGSTGGLLGYSARTLELDDIAAIGRGYPSTGFQDDACGIEGKVTLAGNAYAGAVVTAIEVNNPETIQASTLTYAGGEYLLKGLPPGDYILRIEPAPTGIEEILFFWPEFVDSQSIRPDFPAEYWNTNDAGSELSNLSSVISLTSLGQIATAEFKLNKMPWDSAVLGIDGISAVSGSPSVSSSFVPNRRLMPVFDSHLMQSQGVSSIDVTLSIQAPAAYAGGTVYIVANREQTFTVRYGQLVTVAPDSSVFGSMTYSATLNASGFASISVPVSTQMATDRSHVYFEATATAPGQLPLITNSVAAWFSY